MANSTVLSFISDPNLPEELAERIGIIKHKLKFLENKLTVACIESLQPLTVSGNDVSQLVQIAGGTPAIASTNVDHTYIDWADLQDADPDVIILMPRDLNMDRSIKEVGTLLSQPGFGDLKAVKNNRLYIADGEKYFYKPGAVIIDSLEILAEIINPKQFIFGYEGEGWMKFQL